MWSFAVFLLILARASNLKNTVYRMSCCKSLSALIFALIQKNYFTWLLSEKTWTVYLLDGNSKDGDHSWTYLFDGQSDRGYRMAKMFHLSMPLFALPLTVQVTRQWIDLSNGHIDEGYQRQQECHLSRHVLQSTWCARPVCMQQSYGPGMTCLLE